MDIIIKPGHYQSKQSLNSDIVEIVRIIGPDLVRENYWINSDGKAMADYDLQENYVALDTIPTLQNVKKPLDKLFVDFKTVENSEESEYTEIQKITEEELRKINEVQPKTNFQIPEQKIESLIPLYVTVIEKLNIDKLNDINFEKFGEKKFTKTKLTLQLPIEFNYHLENLKSSIAILDLNINDVLDYIVQKTTTDFNFLLKKELKEYFSEQSTSKINIVERVKESEIVVIEEPIKKQIKEESIIINKINDSIIEEGISEVEEYIKNFLKNVPTSNE